MRALLLKPDENACIAYRNIWASNRDADIDTRYLFYKLWVKFCEYSDSHFVTEFQRNLDARFWEMYLTVLIGDKYEIASSSEGPDIEIRARDKKVWTEAVSVTKGDPCLPDSVPELGAGAVPEEKIILRLTSALKAKLDVHQKYLDNKLLTEDEPYVIAINSAPISKVGDSEHRRILKALFPIGDEYVTFDANTNELSESKFKYRDVVHKANGAEVHVNSFLNLDYKLVSGVIYSNKDCCNIPQDHGSELVFIHNPFAKNPIKKGFFDFGSEYYGEIDGDECTLKLS